MLLKGLEALQLPPMAESSVLSLSPRGTAGNTEAFLQTLCTQLVLSQRKAEHGFHTEQHWDLAVFEIHLHGNSKQTPREVCMAEEEGAPGYVWLCNYYSAVRALPWATSTTCSPLQQWPQEEGSGSVLPHHALSQARSILPRHLESSVTRFKCFKILHFQSKNKQSQRCVTENALNTGVLLLTVNRA